MNFTITITIIIIFIIFIIIIINVAIVVAIIKYSNYFIESYYSFGLLNSRSLNFTNIYQYF